MKCPYCGGDNYETWEEWYRIDGEEGLHDCECCQDCECDLEERMKKNRRGNENRNT